jgi:hypothetical protein
MTLPLISMRRRPISPIGRRIAIGLTLFPITGKLVARAHSTAPIFVTAW